MTLSTKILIWLGAIVLIGSIGFIIYKQIEISRRQTAIETNVTAQKELVDSIARSSSSWATRDDVEKVIKNNGLNLKAIQDDLSKLNANISSVNTIVVSSNGQHNSNVSSTGTGSTNSNPIPVDPTNPDPFGYQSKQQLLSVNEDFNGTAVPVGKVGFSAWQKEPWSVDIDPRTYSIINVIGTDENQKTYIYNKFSVKVQDKSYDVKIASAQTEQIFPEAQMSFWNPRLFIGTDLGININAVKGELTPSLNVGLMSYGKFRSQPDISIIELGVGYGAISDKPQAILTPFTYNIGHHIPLMNNLYVGPSVNLNTKGDISVMGGIRVGL